MKLIMVIRKLYGKTKFKKWINKSYSDFLPSTIIKFYNNHINVINKRWSMSCDLKNFISVQAKYNMKTIINKGKEQFRIQLFIKSIMKISIGCIPYDIISLIIKWRWKWQCPILHEQQKSVRWDSDFNWGLQHKQREQE